MALRSGRQAGGEYCSILYAPTFMFLLRNRLWLDLHSKNPQEEPEQQMSGPETFDHLTRVVSR